MIDDPDTSNAYRERLFDRDGHTFRLMICPDISYGFSWVTNLQLKTPFDAHYQAMKLMMGIAFPYQVWILDETAGDVILPLTDILERYDAIKTRGE